MTGTKTEYRCTGCGEVRRLMFAGYRKQHGCMWCGSRFNPEVTTWEVTEENRHDPDRVFNE